MDELIITYVTIEQDPEHDDAYPVTKVFRFEYDDVKDVESVLAWANEKKLAGSMMENRNDGEKRTIPDAAVELTLPQHLNRLAF